MTAPKELTLLLISDIHFGVSAFSADFAVSGSPPKHLISGAVLMKENLIDTLSSRTIDVLLVSGDLTSTGSPSEFKECYDTVSEIGRALRIRAEDTFFSFGNHDVDWRISSLANQKGAPPDDLYRHVAGALGDLFVKNPAPSSPGPLPGCATHERDQFLLIVANTGYRCAHDQKYSHGALGREQLDWLERVCKPSADDFRWRILLLHHHPHNYPYPTHVEDISSIQEGAELLELIGKSKIDIVCHGHRHHPVLHTMMRDGWYNPVTFLCAGSLAVNEVERRHGEIPNVLHLVHLEKRDEQGAAIGTVSTYKFLTSQGWTKTAYSKEVPLDGEQRFGSIAGEEERTNEARQMINSAITSDSSDYVPLPGYESLAFSLRCLPVHFLNDLVKKVAFDSFSRKVLGLYPDEVVLRK